MKETFVRITLQLRREADIAWDRNVVFTLGISHSARRRLVKDSIDKACRPSWRVHSHYSIHQPLIARYLILITLKATNF